MHCVSTAYDNIIFMDNFQQTVDLRAQARQTGGQAEKRRAATTGQTAPDGAGRPKKVITPIEKIYQTGAEIGRAHV